jgi:RNase H-fold protein (predicted Holliday junction resolvase)
MANHITTVLGISPGTRFTGIAVFRHGELIEYQTKTFTGKVSKIKLQRIHNTIEEIINGYAVDAIVIKIPKGRTKHKGVKQIIADIEKMAAKKHLQVFRCNISGLKQACLSDKNTNRQDLAEYLMQKYPDELSFVRHCGYNRHTYYGKMFEAVAAGLQYGTKQ